jgi:hypothetical protein
MPGQSRVTVARSPSVVVAALCRQGLAKKLDVPPGNEDRFYVAVDRAIENYREIARPKGHPDSPARAARQYARAGKAAVSGSAIRIKSAVDALTPEQRDRLIEVARASGGEEPVSDEKIALAAVIGSGPAREWSPRRKAKMGVPPLRTRGAVTGGRPSRPEVDVLVASLSTALAIATGRPATRGSKNAGRAGKLIPSKLEQLVSAVQDQLGETGQWNPVDRVRSHIRARDGKPSRQR